MTDSDWGNTSAMSLGVYLDGRNDPDTTADGRPMLDDDFLVFINGWQEPLEFTVPKVRNGQAWNAEINTYYPSAAPSAAIVSAGDEVTVEPRSVLVLRGPRSRQRPHARQGALPGRRAAEQARRGAGRSPRSEGVRGATGAEERGEAERTTARAETTERTTARAATRGRAGADSGTPESRANGGTRRATPPRTGRAGKGTGS
jgi:hypothetical protein